MWSATRLEHSSEGYSAVNWLPQSIYAQHSPDSVTERGVRKSLMKDCFFYTDLFGCVVTKSVYTRLVEPEVLSFRESVARLWCVVAHT